MTPHTAAEIISEVTYMPGWRITATPDQYGSVFVSCIYNVPDSSRDFPRYRNVGPVETVWRLNVAGCHTERDVLLLLHQRVLMAIWDHESREFLSLGGFDGRPPRKPLHPHTNEGRTSRDRAYGMGWETFSLDNEPASST